MATDGARLTTREHEVLALLHSDKTNAEIAHALGISLNTVHTHIKHIRQKLGLGHRGGYRVIDTQ